MLSVMKNKIFLITVLAAAGFVSGCDREKSTARQMEKVKAETKQATAEMKDYSYAQKDEFVKTMQSLLSTLDQDLDRLSARIDGSSAAVKAEAGPKLQALRDQSVKLNQQLVDARSATESTWDSAKVASEKAYATLADGGTEVRKWVSDKIAP